MHDGLVAVGLGIGGSPTVKVYDGDNGALRAEFLAFPAGFTGGVQVAVGDVTGDGTPDIIAAAGPGGAPRVRVFDGTDLSLIADFDAYASSFQGGVFVATEPTSRRRSTPGTTATA